MSFVMSAQQNIVSLKSEIAVHQWRRGNTVNQMAAENIGALVEDSRNLHNLLTVNIYKVCMDLPVCIVH